MKRVILGVALVATLGVSACGSHTNATLEQLKKDPKMQKDVETLKKQAWACYKGPSTLRKEGREEFMQCFVPPKRKKRAELCLQKELQRGIPFTKKKREVFTYELAACVVAKG